MISNCSQLDSELFNRRPALRRPKRLFTGMYETVRSQHQQSKGNINLFVFTDLQNNRCQKKLIIQNAIYEYIG